MTLSQLLATFVSWRQNIAISHRNQTTFWCRQFSRHRRRCRNGLLPGVAGQRCELQWFCDIFPTAHFPNSSFSRTLCLLQCEVRQKNKFISCLSWNWMTPLVCKGHRHGCEGRRTTRAGHAVEGENRKVVTDTKLDNFGMLKSKTQDIQKTYKNQILRFQQLMNIINLEFPIPAFRLQAGVTDQAHVILGTNRLQWHNILVHKIEDVSVCGCIITRYNSITLLAFWDRSRVVPIGNWKTTRKTRDVHQRWSTSCQDVWRDLPLHSAKAELLTLQCGLCSGLIRLCILQFSIPWSWFDKESSLENLSILLFCEFARFQLER